MPTLFRLLKEDADGRMALCNGTIVPIPQLEKTAEPNGCSFPEGQLILTVLTMRKIHARIPLK